MATDTHLDRLESLRQLFDSCPYFQLLQMKLVHFGDGSCRLEMPCRRELIQYYGVVQGGALGSLADAAVAFALFPMVEDGTNVVTVEMKINFIRPVAEGTVVAEAKILHLGTKTALGDVEIKHEGKLIAKCLATYMVQKGS